MKITTTTELPDLNIIGLNRILNIHPDAHNETKEKIEEARKQDKPTPLHPEQEIEKRNYPKYEEAKVDPDSTFLHPAIKSKHELKDWVLNMLGYPQVTVELSPSQFDTAIQNALYTYTKYCNFPKKYMLKSSLDYEPGVGIDLSKENVVQVYEVQYGMDFSNWGTILPWMINRTSSGQYGSGNLAGSFITFHNYVEFKKMAQRLMSSEPDWQYNKVAKRLVLIPEPHRHHMQDCVPPYHSEINPHGHLTHPDFRNGIPMVLEVECEPPVWELYSEEHVKRLTLAYCKIILGNVRGKYDGITLPGGGQVTKDIGAEGKEELKEIMDNLRSECAGMPEVYFA